MSDAARRRATAAVSYKLCSDLRESVRAANMSEGKEGYDNCLRK